MTEEEKKQVETILEAAVMFGKITDQVKEEILNNIMESSKIIRPREIAERIGCSQSHVYHQLDEGKISRVEVTEKIIGTTESSLNSYLKHQIRKEEINDTI